MAARDEADRLAARLSHRSAGVEGLESELESLRAAMAVARAEATEREGVSARMEAEAERYRWRRWNHEDEHGFLKILAKRLRFTSKLSMLKVLHRGVFFSAFVGIAANPLVLT